MGCGVSFVLERRRQASCPQHRAALVLATSKAPAEPSFQPMHFEHQAHYSRAERVRVPHCILTQHGGTRVTGKPPAPRECQKFARTPELPS